MKKVLTSVLALLMIAVSLSACTPAKVYKYGVGTVIAVTGKNYDAVTPKDGNYGVNVDIVTVIVDKDGKIVSATWDVAQTSNLTFNNAGAFTADVTKYTQTKVEKGDAYGMKSASTIGKEWYEQAAFMADYVVGMTLADVQAIALDNGYAADADVKAGASMHISAFKDALVKAMNNAVEVKGVAKFGLGHTIAVTGKNFTPATDTAVAKDGNYGVNVDLIVIALDKNDKVVYAKWDIAQCSNLTFDATGTFTADVTKFTKTKFEKGAEYGMKSASTIGKEWFEQSTFMTDYVVGKTAAEVAAIALDNGYAFDADLKAGVSIHISSFIPTIAEAFANAVEVK